MRKGERGDLTKFSKEFWETCVAYGGSDVNVLRDYDILKARKEGKSYSQIAIKFGLSKMQVMRICNK